MVSLQGFPAQPMERRLGNGAGRAAQRLRHAQRARAARGVVGGGRRRGVRRVARPQAQPLLLPPRDRLLPHALRGLGRAVLPGGLLEHLAAGGGARAGHDVPIPRPRRRRALECVVRSLRAGRRPCAPRWLWVPRPRPGLRAGRSHARVLPRRAAGAAQRHARRRGHRRLALGRGRQRRRADPRLPDRCGRAARRPNPSP